SFKTPSTSTTAGTTRCSRPSCVARRVVEKLSAIFGALRRSDMKKAATAFAGRPEWFSIPDSTLCHAYLSVKRRLLGLFDLRARDLAALEKHDNAAVHACFLLSRENAGS